MKALYRKYRPLKLSSVVGQDKTIEQLKGALAQNKISHAYLFIGPRGCGKTSVARIFAHEINHFDYQLEDSYLDIIEIDAATFTGVDNIRELREKAIVIPSAGKYKVYIIDEVHMLSTSAFNALLKILEEPPEHVVFIMATTNPEKIPATILSRTQIYRFGLADLETMCHFLAQVAAQEQIQISPEALQIIAKRGGGSFRDSLSILDQLSTISAPGQTIEATDVSTALGIPEYQEIQDLLSTFESSDSQKTATILSQLLNYGITAEAIATELIQQILQHPSLKTLDLVERLFSVNGSFAEAKLTVALIASHPPLSTSIPQTSASITLSSSSTQTSASVTPSSSSTQTSTSPPLSTLDASNSNNPTSKPDSSATQPSSNPTQFSALRDQLVKNAKSRKAERTTPTLDPAEQSLETPPPTLPEAVVSSTGEFSFEGFVANVTNINPSLMTALKKSFFQFSDKNLDIYPEKPVYWRILSQKNNLEVLRSATNSITLNIKNPDAGLIPKTAVSFEQANLGLTTKTAKNSLNLTSLSAIMGDIQEVTDDPF